MFITAAAKSLLGDLRPDKGASVSASNCLIWNLFMYVAFLFCFFQAQDFLTKIFY